MVVAVFHYVADVAVVLQQVATFWEKPGGMRGTRGNRILKIVDACCESLITRARPPGVSQRNEIFT